MNDKTAKFFPELAITLWPEVRRDVPRDCALVLCPMASCLMRELRLEFARIADRRRDELYWVLGVLRSAPQQHTLELYIVLSKCPPALVSGFVVACNSPVVSEPETATFKAASGLIIPSVLTQDRSLSL